VKLWRNPQVGTARAEAWLYRTAVRLGLDDLRRQTRRARYEGLIGFVREAHTPEEIHSGNEEQDRVRKILSILDPRQAELLLLRSHDLSYTEVAAALDLNPASLGTLLARAQQSFRKEYIKRYGKKNNEVNVAQWVDQRLAILTPRNAWQPDGADGLQRFSRTICRQVLMESKPGPGRPQHSLPPR